jgi:hypothetical protein
MSFHGRSLDDLPLAAYSRGVVPEENEELAQAAEADVSELGHGYPPVTANDHDYGSPAQAGAESAPAAVPGGGRRLSFRLPFRLPALRRLRATPIDEASAPFQPVHHAAEPRGVAAASMAASPIHAAPTFRAPAFTTPTYRAVPFGAPQLGAPAGATPAGSTASGPLALLRDPRALLRHPRALLRDLPRDRRALLRDPRALAGGVVVIGLVLLALTMLGGGGPTSGVGGPGSSQDTTGAQATPVPVGIATVELTSGLTGIYALSAQTGAVPAVDSRVVATWADEFGDTFGLTGPASAGTRTTDANFVLTWSMLVQGAPVMFTSSAGECTVGMAVGAKTVNGTFVCKKLKSADGRRMIDVRGTYRT